MIKLENMNRTVVKLNQTNLTDTVSVKIEIFKFTKNKD